MQRRAIRDAKTPEKMKQAKPVVDDSLTLQGKKEKIKSNLQRLGELGKVHPEKKYQDLINDIAKVLFLNFTIYPNLNHPNSNLNTVFQYATSFWFHLCNVQ